MLAKLVRNSFFNRRQGIAAITLLSASFLSLGFQAAGEDEMIPRLLSVPETSSERGEFTLPVMLSDGEGILAIQFEFSFDSDILEVVSIRPGSLLTDHQIVLNTVFPDEIGAAVISLVLTPFNPGPGSVIEVDFRSIDDEDAFFEIDDVVASGEGGANIEIEAEAIPMSPVRGIPLADGQGLGVLVVLLLICGLSLLKKGTVV